MRNFLISILMGTILMACSDYKANDNKSIETILPANSLNMDTITLGAGCFWCVEAIFQNIKGVESVTSGYSGGAVPNPSYKAICSGTTGHAEVIQVVYDPAEVSLTTILEVFWQTHDPTTLNRQGADAGTQYRSAIFYHTEEQQEVATTIFNRLDDAGAFSAPIVTEITAFTNFFPAEDYHQDYFNQNGSQPYCRAIISPKVNKFKEAFQDVLK